MKQILLGALRLVGSALRAVFVGVIAVAMIAGGVAVANYALTQGSGTNFASVVISTVHYAAGLLCDATVGTTQCAAVTASNALKVDGSAVTQPVSGTVTANAGTNLNTSALATSANQTNKTQFTQLTDGTNAATTYTAYGTAPSGNVPGANVFVTNANGNGAAAASSSSPVTPSNQPVGSATWAATQVSVGSTATQILAARTGVSGTGRICATIENTSTTAVYLGGSGVTTSTGALLPGILGASYTICTTAAIYGIVATGTETVTASEIY